MTPDALGVHGLTIGSVVISCVIAFFGSGGIAAVWLRHRADNRRAEGEVQSGESKAELEARKLTFEQMQKQMEVMGKTIAGLNQRVSTLERHLLAEQKKNRELTRAVEQRDRTILQLNASGATHIPKESKQ